jgi:AIPR protein
MTAHGRVPNDILLLEARLQQQRAETHPDLGDDEYFLISSIDTVLRARDLSHRQIEAGVVEGGNDGGVDAVYLFQDGVLVEDISAASGSDRPELDLEIIQVKNERGFKEVVLHRLLDHLPLLLQLDTNDDLATEFNDRVLERFELFRTIFLRASSRFPTLKVRIRYITKSVDPPNEKVRRKAQRLQRRLGEAFRDAVIGVEMIGAPELNDRARERQALVLDLRVSETPISPEKGGLVCLVSLSEYFQFITDDGRLRDEVFEENVRGYEGATVINRGIFESLRQGDSATADFWWLNNGVTVIGRRVQAQGKKLVIDDPQVVNGLQTSRNIYQYFSSLAPDFRKPPDQGMARQLLIRVIEAADDTLAAQIIRATNSQNRVSVASLRAAEPFQRDIEEYFVRRGLFYERKKNQYKNQGKPRKDIVEVLELAQAVGAIILCQPHTSRGQPSALVRDKLYLKVFNPKTPLASFWNCIQVMRTIDRFLEGRPETPNRQERSQVRFQLARSACAFALSSSRPRAHAIGTLETQQLDDEFLLGIFEWVLASAFHEAW